MTPFRPDRQPREHDPYLRPKIFVFALGAGCAFAGMMFDAGWLITIGILVLGAGVVLRFFGERQRRREEESEWDDVDDAWDDEETRAGEDDR